MDGWMNPTEVKSMDYFAGLWQRLAMASMFPVAGAYDNFCPSLQKELTKRMCKHCKERLSLLGWGANTKTSCLGG